MNSFIGIKTEHWKEAYIKLCYTLIGSLIPIWLGAIIVWIIGKLNSWTMFFIHGEFAIYSAALLASVFYLISSGRERNPFLKKRFLSISTLVLILITAGLFFIAVTNLTDRTILLVAFTIIVFVFSVTIFFFASVLEIALTDTDIRKLERSNIEDLGKKLDKKIEESGE